MSMRSPFVFQPTVSRPSLLAWNMKLPQPGPADWFQSDRLLQFIQYSMVAFW